MLGKPIRIAVLAGMALVLHTSLASAEVIGAWATVEGKSHVKIEKCGEKLCGTIVWLKEPLNDEQEPKTDRNNPDTALQARKIIGLPLLTGFVPADKANKWEGGQIYNPEDGKTYKSTMTLLESGKLEVRGYVFLPLFGKSQVWTRVKQ